MSSPNNTDILLAEDGHNQQGFLSTGDHIAVYTDDASGYRGGARVDAVEELVDRGGGYGFNSAGDPVVYVAPLPRRD